MSIVTVKEITSFCLSEQEGKHLREIIINELKRAEAISVDFSDLTLFASPFFNASLGYLISNLGEADYQNKVSITNLLPTGQKIYNKVIENVIYYCNSKDKDRINEIVNSIDD